MDIDVKCLLHVIAVAAKPKLQPYSFPSRSCAVSHNHFAGCVPRLVDEARCPLTCWLY